MNIEELRRRLLRGLSRRWFRAAEARLRRSQHLPQSGIRRILICRPNHRLGNLLLLTPLLVELQRVFPKAQVDIVLAGDRGAELFRTFPNVKHIYVLSRRMVRHPIAVIRTVMQIRRAKYDLAVDPCETSQSSRFLLAASKATCMLGIPRRSNADSSAAMAERPAPAHMAQWPVFLLRRALSGDPSKLADDYPILTLQLSQEERQRARRALNALLHVEDESSARIVVGVFADATGAKRYDESWWECLIAGIRARHPTYAFVEIAPPDGYSRLSSRLPVFSSPSPREVAAVIANMTCFVSADGGVMHLASASGTPTIGLFSVTDMAKYAPYGPHNQAIDTNGKRPEDIARLASEVVEAVCSNGAGSSARLAGTRLVDADGNDSHRVQDGSMFSIGGGCGFATR